MLDRGGSDWEEGQASSDGGVQHIDHTAMDNQQQQGPSKRQRKRRGNGDSSAGYKKNKGFPSLSQLDQMERNSLSRKALPLFDEGEDPRRMGGDQAEIDGPPMSGFEYLRMVRAQAMGCPDVMIANELPPVLEPSEEPSAESLHQMKRWGIEESVARNIQDSERGDHLPSRQWHTEFVAEFKRLKMVG